MTAQQKITNEAATAAFGAYLRQARNATGMTLRDVEAATDNTISNGYLSQIEKGTIQQPSPRILHRLADVYGITYSDLMQRAGYIVPAATPSTLSSFPMRALDDLNSDEQKALLEYIEFIKSKR